MKHPRGLAMLVAALLLLGAGDGAWAKPPHAEEDEGGGPPGQRKKQQRQESRDNERHDQRRDDHRDGREGASGKSLRDGRSWDSDEVRRVLDDFLGRSGGGESRQGGKNLPPGLAKKAARGEALPPGWQKKLARGERMDQDLYRQSHPLPEDVLRRLPPLPAGHEVRVVGDKVVRVIQSTREILDVLGQ
ncbi:MAG: hypothetical protein HQL51_02765 [Magnetococcales bacterium]|nr:hypothetical protein [Magnetococcales bacterium]